MWFFYLAFLILAFFCWFNLFQDNKNDDIWLADMTGWLAGRLVGLVGLADGMIDWLVQWFMVRLTIFEQGFNFVVKWKCIVTVEVSGSSSIRYDNYPAWTQLDQEPWGSGRELHTSECETSIGISITMRNFLALRQITQRLRVKWFD